MCVGWALDIAGLHIVNLITLFTLHYLWNVSKPFPSIQVLNFLAFAMCSTLHKTVLITQKNLFIFCWSRIRTFRLNVCSWSHESKWRLCITGWNSSPICSEIYVHSCTEVLLWNVNWADWSVVQVAITRNGSLQLKPVVYRYKYLKVFPFSVIERTAYHKLIKPSFFAIFCCILCQSVLLLSDELQ